MQVKKQQLEVNMEQQTGSKLGKKYCHLVYLTYMQSTSCEIVCWREDSQAGIKISGRNVNNLRYSDDITLMAESAEALKS